MKNYKPFLTIRSRFQDKAVQYRRIFSCIESGSIDLPTPNFDETADFYFPQPFSKFQVADSNSVKVIGEKNASYSSRRAKNRQKTRASRVAREAPIIKRHHHSRYTCPKIVVLFYADLRRHKGF